MKKASVKIVLDTRRTKVSGRYSVKLRITYDRVPKYYPLHLSLNEQEFKMAYDCTEPHKDFKKEFNELHVIYGRAIEVINKLKVFTFASFENAFFDVTLKSDDVFVFYEKYIQELQDAGRIGTAENYRLSAKSIKSFLTVKHRKVNKLLFQEITPDFLQEYEQYMLGKGKSATTVGIYLRPLRAMFNLAIELNNIPGELYPFGKRKYQIPSGRNVKKAMSLEDLKKLFEYPVKEGSPILMARDFWFFSYNCNGINVKDIAELKYSNIDHDIIVFVRAKTKLTSKSQQMSIKAYITNFMRSVIEKYGNAKCREDNYVFKVINNDMTQIMKRKAVQNFTRYINQHMKKLARQVGVNENISTYWARHSFSTNAVRKGASLEFIQESLGHHDIKTTMNYWAGFDNDMKKQMANQLMDFDE